jgi:hypothetical protein
VHHFAVQADRRLSIAEQTLCAWLCAVPWPRVQYAVCCWQVALGVEEAAERLQTSNTSCRWAQRAGTWGYANTLYRVHRSVNAGAALCVLSASTAHPGTSIQTSISWRVKHTCSGATAVQLARCLVTTCFRTTAPQSLALVRHVAPARICVRKQKVVDICTEDKDQHPAPPICMFACNDMQWHS